MSGAGDTGRDDHAILAHTTAAYVLGALEPAGRLRLERHLDQCGSCRDRVAEFAALPGLLRAVDPSSIDVPPDPFPGRLADRALSTVGAQRRRDAMTLRAWQLTAVIAAVAALGALALAVSDRAGPDDGVVATARAASTGVVVELSAPDGSAGGRAHATLHLVAKGWGTELQMESTDLPARASYTLWVLGSDGSRQPAATWGPTASGRVRCIGSTSFEAHRLIAVEVVDDGAEVLLRGSL